MGWANCGTDSKGRPIGYAFEAVCDHPGCKAEIDRGLAHACGDMHGSDTYSCEGYYCEDHLLNTVCEGGEIVQGKYLSTTSVCDSCFNYLILESINNPDITYDQEEGVIYV